MNRMVKTVFIGGGILLLMIVGYMFVPADTVNNLARKQVELINGDYNVTYSQDSVTKIYKVRDGKVTSTTKGYYFFWVKTPQGKKYRQVPIDKTIIEQI